MVLELLLQSLAALLHAHAAYDERDQEYEHAAHNEKDDRCAAQAAIIVSLRVLVLADAVLAALRGAVAVVRALHCVAAVVGLIG